MREIKLITGGLLYIGDVIIEVEKIYGLDNAHIWLAGFCSGLASVAGRIDREAERDVLDLIDKIGIYCGLSLEQRAILRQDFMPREADGDRRN